MKLDIVVINDWLKPIELTDWLEAHSDLTIKMISRIDTMFYIFYE